MKKKILAAALASVMALTNVSALFAAEEPGAVSDDLTVTSFFNERTDSVELKDGDSYTFSFKNTSNGENNWDNFILAVTGVPSDEYDNWKLDDNEIAVDLALAVRADNFGWGGLVSDFGALNFDSNINWDNWVAGAKAGYDVNITLTRTGDTLKYDASIGEYYVKLTAASGKALPETLYAFLTGENCVLSGITVTNNNAEPDVPEIPEGNLTVTSFFNERTDSVELKDGDSYTFSFKNTSNGENNWDNFILAVTGVPSDEYDNWKLDDNEIAVDLALAVRADNFGWGGLVSDFGALNFDSNINWDNWVAGAKAGYDVSITLTRTGDTLKYDASIGEYYVKLTAVSGKALPETLYAFLTGENCVLSGITVTKNNTEPDVPEIPEGAVSLGNLTVTSFFNERTDSVELKDGDSYTFSFKNTSNGENNWDNFIFAVTGVPSDEYDNWKLDDNEIAVDLALAVRADNFGWGGLVSDFGALNFDSNINWDNWVAGAKAGYDVNITLTRTGDTLKYDASIGEYYVKLTAASGKALPETLYAFLTGENCVLSGITATKNNTEPDVPDIPEIPEGAVSLGNLTVTTFFNEKTSTVGLKSGESQTIKFHNKSNGTANWENFVLVVTGEETVTSKSRAADQEVLVIRADSWGWGGGLSDISAPDGTTNVLVFENNILDWDEWRAGAQAGYDVELTISRYENTLAYEAKMGKYNIKTAITSGKTLPEDLFVFLTGENCVLSNIIATKGDGVVLEAVEPVNKPTEPVTIPEGSFGVPAAPAESAELGDSNTISNDLTVTSFFAEKTPAVTLVSGGSYTFKFKNKSNGFNNWDNFVMAVTGEIGSAYTGADQEILVIRADSWGWGGGYSDFVAPDQSGNALAFDTNIDWDKWVAGARAGYDVEITISRDGNTLTYDAKIGDYYVKLKATSGKALPKNTYVFFTGENCVLSGITTTNNNPSALGDTSEPEEETATTTAAATEPIEAAPAETTTVNLGDLTVTNFFAEKTNAVELKNGGSYTFKFNNKSNGTNNWENFVMAITGETGAAYTGADQEILVIRADSWGWGGGYSDFVAPDQAGNALVFDTNIDWDKWVAGAQAGYDVEITIGKNGNTLTYDAKIGDYYVKLTATSGKALPDSAYVFFTGENCVLSGITATDNNPAVSGNTAPASQDTSSSAPQATTAAQDTAAPAETAKPAAPVSLGDLTVTNFFNEKTAAVELKSGESYSFKFNNKSNGTNNWDNFILAIAGETGAAYTGADQEVLIIRADNWGWGGGYSDFVSPDQAGNALVFDTNIDWDKWVAGAQAGYDVNITLTRSGNTLKYYASIGDYYVKLTATSGKKLPETLYVFLTGENCVLSGITATALTDSSPNTGIAAPCALAVVAIASSAAIVILKKKSAK